MNQSPDTPGNEREEIKAFEEKQEHDLKDFEARQRQEQQAFQARERENLEEFENRERHEFTIKIDRTEYVVHKHELTGQQLRDLPTPPIGPEEPKGKISILLALLRRPDGAGVEEMMAATGWQAHSVRGAMSGAIKKKLGIAVASEKTEGGRLYRCCQSNGNLSPAGRSEPKPSQRLSHDCAPLGQGGRASLLVDFAADEVALLIEMVVN